MHDSEDEDDEDEQPSAKKVKGEKGAKDVKKEKAVKKEKEKVRPPPLLLGLVTLLRAVQLTVARRSSSHLPCHRSRPPARPPSHRPS